jgi:hypothetical protein
MASHQPQPAPLKLFISHSSKDRELVRLLVDLLKEALGLRSDEIRATGLPGFGLHAGASLEDRIRFEVDQADVLIGVVSEASLDSLYVAFELGARWHAGKLLIPLLAPGLDPDRVPEPLRSKHALQCSEEGELFALIETLERCLALKEQKEKSSALQPRINAIRQYCHDRTTSGWYGLRFTVPEHGEILRTRAIHVKGTFRHRPPAGTVHIFHASDDENRWWPVAEPEFNDATKIWSADMRFEKGEQPYDAWIVITLVSQCSIDLVRYIRKLPEHLETSYRDGRGELEKHKEFNSLFGRLKPDGIEVCDKRKVLIRI